MGFRITACIIGPEAGAVRSEMCKQCSKMILQICIKLRSQTGQTISSKNREYVNRSRYVVIMNKITLDKLCNTTIIRFLKERSPSEFITVKEQCI